LVQRVAAIGGSLARGFSAMPAQALVQTLRLAGMQGLAIKTSNKSPDILALSRSICELAARLDRLGWSAGTSAAL
jgi:hypothetical protein